MPMGTVPSVQFVSAKVYGACDEYYLCFNNGFTTSRAHSMKSCATGVGVRFFKVIIPTGNFATGKSTGTGLSDNLLAPKCIRVLGRIVRKRPVASSALRATIERVLTTLRGASRPFARKASRISDQGKLSNGAPHQGSSTSSASSILRRRVR